MKTIIRTLVLVSIACAGNILAQTNTAVAPSGTDSAAAPSNQAAAAPANAVPTQLELAQLKDQHLLVKLW